MATLPKFKHIHCSSRYDRSPESLEADLDDWMDHSSLVTLTEITNDRRAATLQEKGWNYYNARIGPDSDNCGICWRLDTWKRTFGVVKRLSTNTFDRFNGMHNLYIYSCSVVLKHVTSGHKMLVSVSHLPSHIEGDHGLRSVGVGWEGRKRATRQALNNWATQVKDLERKQHCDGALVIADWNLNLKDQWVWNLIHDQFTTYRLAWNQMPTAGGAVTGGPSAPQGAPGVSTHDRIIDGTLYRGLKLSDGPNLMARVRSSDHRPYNESFTFLSVGEKEPVDPHDTPSGDVKHPDPWWGFGDTMTDEIYALESATGDAGGEVL